MENYTTILASNTKGITPAKMGGVKSDSIFYQVTKNRITELSFEINMLTLSDVKMIPILEEVGFKYKDNEFKAIYVKNPAKNRANELVALYKKDGNEWEKVEKLDEEIEIKGINPNGFRVSNIHRLVVAIMKSITNNMNEEYNDDFIKGLEYIYENSSMDDNGVLKIYVPNVENIENYSKALQLIWSNSPEKIKEETIEEFKQIVVNESSDKKEINETINEIEKIITKLEENSFYLKPDDISYIDENSLYKLTGDYVRKEKKHSIIEADRKMALRLQKINPEIQNSYRKVLNYYLTGLMPDGNIFILKNEGVRAKPFYEDSDVIKKKSESHFNDLITNYDKFSKDIQKGNERGFLKALGAWNYLIEKANEYLPNLSNVDEKELKEMSAEEKKALYEQIKEEMRENQVLKEEFKRDVNHSINYINALKNSGFISYKTARVFESELNEINENIDKKDIIELFAKYRNAQKAVTIALNAFKESVYIYKMKGSVTPTADGERFPVKTAGSVEIDYNDLNNLEFNNEENYSRYAILAFSVKEIGKNQASLAPIAIPIAMFDSENNVAKFKYGASNIAKAVDLIQHIYALKEHYEGQIEDKQFKNDLTKAKGDLVTILETIKTQKASKIFNIVTAGDDVDDKEIERKNKEKIKEIFSKIKSAKNFEQLVNAINEIPAFKNINNLPNVSMLLKTSFSESKIVEEYLKENNLKPNDKAPYYSALSNVLLAEGIKNSKKTDLESLKNDEVGKYVSYTKHFITNAIKGDLVYRKDNKFTFLPQTSLGDDDLELIKEILEKNSQYISIDNDIKMELKEKYGVVSKKEELKKVYEGIGSLINTKKKNPLEEIAKVKVSEEIEQKAADDEVEELVSDIPDIDSINPNSIINDALDSDIVSTEPETNENDFEDVDQSFTENDPFLNENLTMEDSLWMDEGLFSNELNNEKKTKPKLK